MSSPMRSPQAQHGGVRQRVPRMAEAAVERARLTVVPRTRTQAARIPFVSLVTLLLLGGVVGLLLFNTSMQQSSFTASDLQQQATVLSAKEEQLAMRLEEKRDPQVVATRAQSLGMQVPAAPLFLDLADGSVEGDPEAATATTGIVLRAAAAPKPAELATPQAVVVPPEGELPEEATGASAGDRGGSSDDGAREKKDKKNKKKNEKKNEQGRG